ncbi:hypothetical protein DFH28DRAFT_973735 [Melampsora americana]|nr:hypothetical protein DFH28DRAFT_973735 [Melampsora americana]
MAPPSFLCLWPKSLLSMCFSFYLFETICLQCKCLYKLSRSVYSCLSSSPCGLFSCASIILPCEHGTGTFFTSPRG